MREKIRVAGDMPSLKILDLMDQFQDDFKGRLQIDRVVDIQNEQDCWYMNSLDADL